MSILRLNGIAMEDLHLALAGEGALWSTPRVERSTASPISTVGVRPSAVSRGVAKEIPLQLVLEGDLSERRARLDAVIHNLNGLVLLEWLDAPGRVQIGRIPGNEVSARFDSLSWLDRSQFRIDCPVTLDTPLSFEWTAQVLAVSTSRVPVSLGTATSSAALFEFPAVSSALTITYRGITGEVLAELSIAGPNLSSGELLLVDVARSKILTWDGTSFAAGGEPDTEDVTQDLYIGGSFPVFDDGDGLATIGAWPTIEASAAGTCTYRRAWE